MHVTPASRCGHDRSKTPNSPLQICDLLPGVWTVHLLEGKDGTYWEPEKINAQAYDPMFFYIKNPNVTSVPAEKYKTEEYRKAVFDVVDIDDDGNKEIFSVVRTGGSGAYSFAIYVYDSLTKEPYWLKASGDYMSPMLDYRYSANASQNYDMYTWMNQKAKILTIYKPGEGSKVSPGDDDRYEIAIQDWLQSNGRGFYEGPLKLSEFEGTILRPDQIVCSVDDGEYKWVSYFKGELFGYNEGKGTYFVVYVPYSAYDWVSYMVAGERYLWLGAGTDRGILVFDKETRTLKIVSVPEVSELIHQYTFPSGSTYPDSLSIRVSDISLYAGDTRLTLPDYVNAEAEFENAVVCSPS